MIIIVNGSLGVGKTAVSWRLVEQFDRAVMLDGDYIGAVHPFQIYDSQRIDYLYRTFRHLVAFHIAHGYRNFVINYVFETPESLSHLRHSLAAVDDEIYAFRLISSDAEAERRIRGRSDDLDQVKWELKRYRDLAAIQQVGATRGDLGFVIDTTARSPLQVAAAIWQNIHEEVALAPYHPDWPAQFEAERLRLAAALGDRAIRIDHIGSTAVPGLTAKPVIDILVGVRKLNEATACIVPLQTLGYTFIDFPQNIDRRFFRKGIPRTHHLHIVEQGSPAQIEHLAFRDALRADAGLRDQYAALKAGLAARYTSDRATYSASKTEFVRRVVAS